MKLRVENETALEALRQGIETVWCNYRDDGAKADQDTAHAFDALIEGCGPAPFVLILWEGYAAVAASAVYQAGFDVEGEEHPVEGLSLEN